MSCCFAHRYAAIQAGSVALTSRGNDVIAEAITATFGSVDIEAKGRIRVGGLCRAISGNILLWSSHGGLVLNNDLVTEGTDNEIVLTTLDDGSGS